ncbi:hypothetical protein [Halococcus qingdaonensis]|uniref:hypothetical protein n=1 Tax=Halococcus qingdaonensis TaxID=224402 RepID=UPI002116E51A|nr:hypothetical protein [Halococcus qingdaonensis]
MQNLVSLSAESEEPLRSIRDVVLDVTDLVDALKNARDRIETIHVVGDEYLTLECDETTCKASDFGDVLDSEGHSVEPIDVLGERDLAE